jgi:hypothetical protein
MIFYALVFAFACIGLGLLCNLWRLVSGPTTADRILALDTMVINSIAMIVLSASWNRRPWCSRRRSCSPWWVRLDRGLLPVHAAWRHHRIAG